MNWPWRMPRDLPWATPYPLPRNTSEALLAEGRCENFGLFMERYLAFGDNRGQLQLLRELINRRALVPDFTGQKELIEAYCARWEHMADELGATTFSALPQWRVIVGLGTNEFWMEESCFIRSSVFRSSPRPPSKARLALCHVARGGAAGRAGYTAGEAGRRGQVARRSGVSGRYPRHLPWSNAT